MELTFLKAKIHRARVTHSEPDYEGSCAIDKNLLLESGIAEYEQIEIYNLVNGERISTYTIVAVRSCSHQHKPERADGFWLVRPANGSRRK